MGYKNVGCGSHLGALVVVKFESELKKSNERSLSGFQQLFTLSTEMANTTFKFDETVRYLSLRTGTRGWLLSKQWLECIMDNETYIKSKATVPNSFFTNAKKLYGI